VTGALTWARLSFRQQKWELILVALVTVGAAMAMVYFATTLDAMRAASPECLNGLRAQFESPSGPPLACQAIVGEWYEIQGSTSMLGTFALGAPLGIGVILGAPLVAREIDGGTAQLAWSLSGSRTRWLLRRIGFVTAFALVLLAVVAAASELMSAAVEPDRDLAEDFAFFGQRGLPVVARGAGALMIGVLVGSLVGRVLPAVLAAVLIIGLAFAGLSLGQEAWNRGEATIQRFYDDEGQPVPFDFAAMDVDYGLQRPDGEVLNYGDAYESGILTETYQDELGRIYASEADMEAGRVFGHDIRLVIAAERYPELALRDSVLWVLSGLAAFGAAAIVVTGRRPV
jgi:hypothetical protein